MVTVENSIQKGAVEFENSFAPVGAWRVGVRST